MPMPKATCLSRFANLKPCLVGLLLLLIAPSLALADAPQEVRGTVKDRSGAVVARAQVVLTLEGQQLTRVTQPDGTFVFSGVTASSGTIVVTASGFATTTTAWHAGENQITITLALAAVQQSLDVTGTRTAILPTGVDDVEAQPDAVVVTDDQLAQWGALATDDKLRQVPGFSLLRRSGKPDRQSHIARRIVARSGCQRRESSSGPG